MTKKGLTKTVLYAFPGDKVNKSSSGRNQEGEWRAIWAGQGRAEKGVVALASDTLNLLFVGQPIGAVSETVKGTGLGHTDEWTRASRKGKQPLRVPTRSLDTVLSGLHTELEFKLQSSTH